LDLEDKYFDWHESDKISMGVIRNTLRLTEIMKKWRDNNDSSKLIWHPYLSYMINRNLKGKGNTEIDNLYKEILSISNTSEGTILKEQILFPALCGVIYKLRRS